LVYSTAHIRVKAYTNKQLTTGQSEGDWREDLGIKVTKAIKEIPRIYRLTATEPALAEQASPATNAAG